MEGIQTNISNGYLKYFCQDKDLSELGGGSGFNGDVELIDRMVPSEENV